MAKAWPGAGGILFEAHEPAGALRRRTRVRLPDGGRNPDPEDVMTTRIASRAALVALALSTILGGAALAPAPALAKSWHGGFGHPASA